MSTTACLAWGSLVWDPRGLRILEPWRNDGPLLHVEFARESSDKRITLVLTNTDVAVQSYWALLDVVDLVSAKELLRAREGIPSKNLDKHIGTWSVGQESPWLILNLSEWAARHDVENVVWTNLPPKFGGSETIPVVEQVVDHLSRLEGEERKRAEEYIRHAPKQIDTAYRRAIEKALGWIARG